MPDTCSTGPHDAAPPVSARAPQKQIGKQCQHCCNKKTPFHRNQNYAISKVDANKFGWLSMHKPWLFICHSSWSHA